jgi:hypothetical protein
VPDDGEVREERERGANPEDELYGGRLCLPIVTRLDELLDAADDRIRRLGV